MDDRDLDILRWMYPGGVWSPWGTDPRITITDVAAHVALDRTAVWARLRKWRREGFIDGFETHPNLRIFGVGALLATFRVADSAEGWDLMDKAGDIDGVVGACLHFGDSLVEPDVEHVCVTMVADTPAKVRWRTQALGRISPTGVVDGPAPLDPGPCSWELTQLDWRILGAMVANPNASAPRAAALIGISPKTFEHHRSALVDNFVVRCAPILDWSKMGCVTLGFYCRAAVDVEGARRSLQDHVPHAVPISLMGMAGTMPVVDPSTIFAFIVPAHSPNEVQKLVRDLSKLPGVTKVRPEFWGPWRGFSSWAERRIAEHVVHPAPGGNPVATSAPALRVSAPGPPRREGSKTPAFA
jgi:hypothetical protein